MSERYRRPRADVIPNPSHMVESDMTREILAEPVTLTELLRSATEACAAAMRMLAQRNPDVADARWYLTSAETKLREAQALIKEQRP